MKLFLLCLCLLIPLSCLAQLPRVGAALKDPLSKQSVKEMMEERIDQGHYCDDVQMKDTNLSKLSRVLNLSDSFPVCLEDGKKWKRVIESDQLSSEDQAWISSLLCTGKDQGKKLSASEFCDYLPEDDCPSCLLEKYKAHSGEVEGFKLWAKAVERNFERMIERRGFIKQYLLKPNTFITP